MKKILYTLVSLILILFLAACEKTPDNTSETTGTEKGSDTVVSTDASDTGETAPGGIDAIPLQEMLYLFDDMTGLGMGAYCVQEEITTENVGMFLGTDAFDLPFEGGLALSPQMNITPFVLTLFRVSEETNADAFAEALSDAASLNKWICVSADTKAARAIDNTVLFFMSPADMEQPLLDCFAKMGEPGFRTEEHLIDPLAGTTPLSLYEALYESFSIELYGFMDGTYETKDVPSLDVADFETLEAQSEAWLTDTGYLPADEFDGERSYFLAIFRLGADTDASAFAATLEKNADLSTLKGEGVGSMVAISEDTVIYFAGKGSLSWLADSLAMTFSGTYRMETRVEMPF